MNNNFKFILAAVIGNIMEWYDFILFALFATIISKNFFPDGNQNSSLMATFGVFAVGYLMRPLGGVLLGHIGDRWSRKLALICSMLLMGLATSLIGLLPTYTSIGSLATFMLITLRMIQGIAVGGEFPGSIVILFEVSTSQHRAFLSSLGLSGSLIGILISTGVVNLLMATLPHELLLNWVWRAPFLLSLLLVLLGLYLRLKLFSETHITKDKSLIAPAPIIAIVKYHKKLIFKLLLMIMPTAVYTGIFSLFLVTYVNRYLHFQLYQAFRLSFVVSFFLLVFFPIGAAIADKTKNYSQWIIVGNLILAVVTYPLYLLMQYNELFCYLSFISMAILFALAMGPAAAFFISLLPSSIQYSGFAIVHGLAFSIVAGTSPLILNWLANTIHISSPAFYGIISTIISAVAIFFTKLNSEVLLYNNSASSDYDYTETDISANLL